MTSNNISLGHLWTVPADPPAEEDERTLVTFTSPTGRVLTVRARADEAGDYTATVALNEPGEWTAAAGDVDHTATVPDTDPAPAAAADEFDPKKGGSIPATLAWVGDDHDRAQTVLDLEEAKDEPARRTSLIDKLYVLLDA